MTTIKNYWQLFLKDLKETIDTGAIASAKVPPKQTKTGRPLKST